MNPVEIRVPGDKSITHRALIFASLAEGSSRIARPLDSADTRSTAEALRALGIDVGGLSGGETVVHGGGTRGWRAPTRVLDCGNSGTTTRLLLGALAGCPFEAELTGDESLSARPMRRVTDPLSGAGASFDGAEGGDRLPIRVRGSRPLRSIAHRSPRASAQVKSALLLAGVTGEASVRVGEPWLSRDHTERMLAAMGARLTVTNNQDEVMVELTPGPLEALDVTVPGDPSSAAFFLGLGALAGAVRTTGISLNPTRTGFLPVLARMGAGVAIEETGRAAGEPLGDVVVTPGGLVGTTVSAAEVPALLDEIPLLAAVAALATGESRFEGVAELRVKETDRLEAVVTNLRALGVEAGAEEDALVVVGTGAALRGRVRSFGDHRIAMAFGVLGALDGNRIEVDGREAVDISFPAFWKELERVTTELART